MVGVRRYSCDIEELHQSERLESEQHSSEHSRLSFSGCGLVTIGSWPTSTGCRFPACLLMTSVHAAPASTLSPDTAFSRAPPLHTTDVSPGSSPPAGGPGRRTVSHLHTSVTSALAPATGPAGQAVSHLHTAVMSPWLQPVDLWDSLCPTFTQQ